MNPDIQSGQADRKVDRMYGSLRGRYGKRNPRANGYRLEIYFLREQETILREISADSDVVLDIACGSGLMLQPLLAKGTHVIGVDYNNDACAAARDNNIKIIRGNAFKLPVRSGSIDQAINCQFLNQQHRTDARLFISESFRVLKPGGRLVLVWRNGSAIIHRVARVILEILDRILGRLVFPQIIHTMEDITACGLDAGFRIVRQEVTFPLLRWRTGKFSGVSARIIGASCLLILEKPE